jgi:hypothetical protein
LYSLPNIIAELKIEKDAVFYMWDKRESQNFGYKNLMGAVHLEDTDTDERIILKLIFEKWRVYSFITALKKVYFTSIYSFN